MKITAKQGKLRHHGYEGTNIAYTCKIFVAVTLHLMGISILHKYTCSYNLII